MLGLIFGANEDYLIQEPYGDMRSIVKRRTWTLLKFDTICGYNSKLTNGIRTTDRGGFLHLSKD